MICVSIGRGRHKHMIAEHRHLADQGAKLVELRLDYINGTVNLKRLLADKPCPVVITCRREQDGGRWEGTEEERIMLMRSAIVTGVDYVDLEEDVAKLIPRYGATKRIIGVHDFQQTPGDLPGVVKRLKDLDADIVKLATMANSPHDNLRMLETMRDADFPVVGMCMGEIGTPSRILAGKFGAPFAYATFHHERSLAPGQLSYRQMTDIYRYDEIGAETEVYGVIADPIGQDVSPRMFNVAFGESGVDKVYLPFRVPAEEIDEFLADCLRLGIRGLSVMAPHHGAIIPKLTKIDGAVRGIGATNAVVFRDADLIGYNTQYRAAMDCVDAMVGSRPDKSPLSGRSALVLGAGELAKATAFGLLRRGANVAIANRTYERGETLAKQLGCSVLAWDKRHSITPYVLVNATPVGMHPNVDETPYDKRHLRPSMIVLETVYNPEQTLFVKEAREQHCRVLTGVEMFVRQAAVQFRHFTGLEPPMDRMRNSLKGATGAVKAAAGGRGARS
jgi:3-dehydroquinate dehydratase/shikimate dehydrogenase